MTDLRDQPPIGEDDLHAYVDERLDAARLALVRAWLEQHPEAAARVRAFAAQRDALRAALAPRAAEPIPSRLRVAHVRSGLRARLLRQWRMAAAAVLLLLTGAGAGWLAHGNLASGGVPGASPTMAEAAEAHRIFAAGGRQPNQIVASVAEELATRLAGRLGEPVVVPDLLAAGFRPRDAHLLPTAEGPAVQVTYERIASDTRLSFYMRPAPDRPADKLRCADHPGGRVTYYWFDGRRGYAVTAALPRSELRGIAFLAEREVRAGPKPPPADQLIARTETPRVCIG
jgi:anti-sigma factor RsiW